MARKDFTEKTLLERFVFAGGRCEWVEHDTGIRCYAVLKPGDWHGDHDIPDRMGGKNDFDNCRCLCLYHHTVKTAEIDAPRIAKTRRQEAKHVGANKQKWKKAEPQRRASKPVNKWYGYKGQTI